MRGKEMLLAIEGDIIAAEKIAALAFTLGSALMYYPGTSEAFATTANILSELTENHVDALKAFATGQEATA